MDKFQNWPWKNTLKNEYKEAADQNMSELRRWGNVETMCLQNDNNRKKFNEFVWGKKWKIQIFLQNHLADAIKKLWSKVGLPTMIERFWNCAPNLVKLVLDEDAEYDNAESENYRSSKSHIH